MLEFQIEGNTVLPAIDVERAVTPYLGVGKTIKDVEAARKALERVYHDRGYKTVLVDIPQQRVAEGVVRLRVVEASVGKLKIIGSRYHSLLVIRETMTQLNPGTVPNFNVVQQELGDVNRSPDLRVTPVLHASETPGRMDVDLQVQDRLPLHFMLEVNNRYSANTAHVREIGELRYDNLFQRNQSISLQYQIAAADPPNSEIFSASYVIPTRSGPVWALYYIHSDSNVAAVGSIDVIGKGDIYGLRWIDPLPTGSRDFFHSFTAGIDHKNFGQNVTPQGQGTVESPVRYNPFTLDYSATWLGAPPAQGVKPAATSYARSSTYLDLGVNVLVAGDWQQFAARRAGAGPSYILLHPNLIREQVLPGQWSVVGRVGGQLASGPLINNEQFAIGGLDSVRGYTEAERLGDDGVDGSIELRTPQLLAGRFPRSEQSYASLFVDAGRVRILEPLPEQTAVFSLASAGIGLRFKAAGLFIGLDGARILKDGAVTPQGRYRGSFTVSYSH
ncbi:MAG: ShlB/FhaC/HecB family hemolysin secretion/activation protein [Gammaproteobacteria bacterium]|nr:ShlB/FhaC/HecB family hemolysin secretion/activation protein [Gammaproteobacteria bacterium]